MMSSKTMVDPRDNYIPHPDADKLQASLYKRFSPDAFLGNPQTVDHTLQWITFFRRNLHRFATDYLCLKLHLYQQILLYMLGVCHFIVVIASRASAKSFILALYACCQAILFPNSLIVLSASTKRQAKLMVSEKIEKELMNMSSILKREIIKIIANQNETVIYFRNHSTITVVIANDNGRGYRSTCLIREEFRQIDKYIDDSVLSPFQVVRQTPFMKEEFYANKMELVEEAIDVYISSSWYDNGHWMWGIVDQACDEMIAGKKSCLLAFDEAIALKHKIKTMRYFQSEKKKQDPLTWRIEFMNERVKENTLAFFSYTLFQQNQREKKAFYPRTLLDFKSGRKNPYDIPKQKNEVRIVSCDMAFVENKKNDNSIFSCIRLLPESTTYSRESLGDLHIDNGYRRKVVYMEPIQGGNTLKQAVRIRQLYEDFGADYIVLDTRNGGSDAAHYRNVVMINAEENWKAEMLIRVEGYA